MSLVSRVLPRTPVTSLDRYVDAGGGRGLEAARKLGPSAVIEDLTAAGLRGRGGAGFPTGLKWAAVAEHGSPTVPATVVVNGAEGEPGTFKDRTILRCNPFAVLEGALIAAVSLAADGVVVALKESFTREIELMRSAIDAVVEAGWAEGLSLAVFPGPGEYLYGEETALLEAIDGRPPFPRIAPPFRHGVEEVGTGTSASAARVTMAEPGTAAPPSLVNNVETLANVPAILAEGPDWFRSLGTAESPGTIVCTVTGDTRRHGVGEVPMGTPLADVIDAIAGGPQAGQELVAAMSGVAHPLLPASRFTTPLSYEALDAAGSGLGAAGFICFDDRADLLAVALGVAHFLAVESCGQCTPCKADGLAIAEGLTRIAAGEGDDDDVAEVRDRLSTVTDEARCFLAHQQQRVVNSVLRLFPDAVRAHLEGATPAVQPAPIAPIVELEDGRAVLDERQARKQSDWTFDDTDSGQWPAARSASHLA
jgi:NADH:ubiquinone oxidoreductase subunit F (NADH-binding)